jgi:hypothetical protein
LPDPRKIPLKGCVTSPAVPTKQDKSRLYLKIYKKKFRNSPLRLEPTGCFLLTLELKITSAIKIDIGGHC